MNLFPNPDRPRTMLDLRVGKHFSVECIFHVRQSDHRDWFVPNRQAIQQDILDRLSSSILPRHFREEMEAHYREKDPTLLGEDPKEKETNQIGKKNKKKAATTADKRTNNKRKQTSTTATKKKKKKKIDPLQSRVDQPEKDVYFSFGEFVQISYQKQPLPPSAHSQTIWMGNKKDDDGRLGGGNSSQAASKVNNGDDKKRSTNENEHGKKEEGAVTSSKEEFYELIKLQHRLLLWLSPLNEDDPTAPDASNVGFYRPEMIPLCSIFREPQSSLAASTNNKDETPNE